MNMVRLSILSLFAVFFLVPKWTSGQSTGAPSDDTAYLQAPKSYRIIAITVSGTEDESTQYLVVRQSGLTVGQEVTVPHDEAFSRAIRRLYRLGIFSNVQIIADRYVGDEVYLLIKVQEEPRLGAYTFSGVKKSHREDLRKQVPLLRGQSVRPGDIERTRSAVKRFYREKGFPLADVEVTRTVTEDNRLDLDFKIDRGQRLEVRDIIVSGNQLVSERMIRKKMKETKENRWWRFWKRETFKEAEIAGDLDKVIAAYNERGFYDARIVRDSAYVVNDGSGKPYAVVEIDVHEGARYKVRNVEWDGNTTFTDAQLTAALGFEPGDAYNSKRFESNLFANRASSDVASLYYNRGYVQFNVVPSIQEAGEDSLDFHFEIYEGDIFKFGDVQITGNNKTKDHVIRRQLRTLPGNTFSRDAIQRSLRELSQLGYFNPETLIPETQVNPEEKVVDVTYAVEETGGDQLEFSGGWGGYGGVLLQAGVTFNNFSLQNMFNRRAWRPLPSGDGQRLSLSVQVQGGFYQSYSLSFQEPWFRGLPRPVGLSVSHSRYNLSRSINRFGGVVNTGVDDRLSLTAAQLSYGRALEWPDDYFSAGVAVGYRLYQGGSATTSFGLPPGTNQALTFTPRISRNSLDDPMFPSAGSSVTLSVEVAPPFPQFIQYHKWRLASNWNLPIANKLSLGVGLDHSYVGSLEKNEEVQFERFLVGGTPFDAQFGRFGFGKDLVYMRGYPAGAIGLRDAENILQGGTVLNKYVSEIRFMAVRSPQLALQLYGFLDAVNTWNGFESYSATDLYRSGGMGVRIFLPILGMMNLNYGYNFDAFAPIPGRDNGVQKWRFQFSLGQNF